MADIFCSSQTFATLFYKESCPPCRVMSRIAVILALGLIRRSPLDAQEAKALYALHPGHEGQLLLADGRRVWFQRMVYAALPRCMMTGLTRVCAQVFLPKNLKRG